MSTLSNPATGTVIAERARHSRRDVEAAAAAARSAQPAWAGRNPRERARVIRRAVDYIVGHVDELSAVVGACTGKPRIDALAAEVLPAAITCDYYARCAHRFLKPRRIGGSSVLFFNKRSTLRREAYGLIGIITPWNYPLGIPMHEVVTGLLCGNAVLLKVATQAQPVGDAIARMLAACELPPGLFHALHLPGAEAADSFLDAGIGKLFFTGSTEVGRELAIKAGGRLIPFSLELGGNDAMVVLEDANLERAAGGAVWAGIANTGQSCGAVERLYVVESVYDRFLATLSAMVSRLSVGPDHDFATDVGSLTTEAQLETVKAHLDEALSRGARIVAEASPKTPDSAGGLFHPAVVVEVNEDDSALVRHETFGPILAVRRVADEVEALRLANDSYLGLTASVWTRSSRRARRLAARLETGVVTVNDHLMSHGMPETPWGGYKQSGIGRCHGELGFHEMSRPKVVVEERLSWMKKNMWWHPYSLKVYEGLRAALVAVHGRGPLRRIAAAARLTGLFLSRALGRD